jgi:hypothetical protein
MLINIAILSQSNSVPVSEIMSISAALQKQVSRDFGPLWNISATIDSFAALEGVPVGYWPLIVVDQVPTGELGAHGQRDHQPIAIVQAKSDWSLTASHEILEMLADPFANRLIAGDSVTGDGTRVEYLVEVCDPCQDAAYGYRINGVLVSDFYTPQYFAATGTTGDRYDFVGAMLQPRAVLEGGYLSWRDPMTNHLCRVDMINSQIWVSDLGDMPTTGVSLRSHIDSMQTVKNKRRLPASQLRRLRRPTYQSRIKHVAASQAKADRLKRDFISLSKQCSSSSI